MKNLDANDPRGCADVEAAPVTGKPDGNYSIPDRYSDALYQVVPDLMPAEFVNSAGDWLQANLRQFVRGGDPEGVSRFNYELVEVDKWWPRIGELRGAILRAMPAALEKCGVDPFDLEYVETHATLYHHGGHFCWHDDAPDYSGNFAATRRITFCYYLHSTPKMFTGGELEFLDGTLLEPANNSLVFFHPLQQHRIREVECWSKEALHGRWAFFGWIHGQPPPGYSRPKLRGIPSSG